MPKDMPLYINYKANMEEELIDKYRSWEEELQQKEEKQRNLGQNQQ